MKAGAARGVRIINSISLIGRLVRDPEIRTLESGKQTTTIVLAVDRPHVKDKTDFITCICWGKVAEIVADNMSKGRQFGVTGYLQIRNFDGKDGKKVYMTEVVFDQFDFLGPKPDRQEAPPREATPGDSASQFGQDVANYATDDPEIPF